MMASSKIVGKFRGCLVGGLIGDCYGAPFEWDRPVSKSVLKEFLSKKLVLSKAKGGFQVLPYTDDTEMARSVAESFIQKNDFKPEDMANRFAEEYFRLNRPKRGYGTFVTYVFKNFKEKSYKDVFDPAKEQFDGLGSFGNGAAMRTHPVALFCHNKEEEQLIKLCRQVAQLTHAHMDGYNGAILQTLALRQALQADPQVALDSQAFLDSLHKAIAELETKRTPHPKYPSLCTQINQVKTFLKAPVVNVEKIVEVLGVEVTAVFSVPTAIYCFLRAQQPIDDYKTDNPFLRTLYLSVSLGGDTDTIGCMACSLAGAFYGTPSIPEVLYEQCEASSEILQQADKLAKLVGML